MYLFILPTWNSSTFPKHHQSFFHNFVLLCMLLLAKRIFLLSVWPASLTLQVLLQVMPSIVGNTFSWTPTAILSFLLYSGIVIYLFTRLSDRGDCEILQNEEPILHISILSKMCNVHHIRQLFDKCGMNECKNEEKANQWMNNNRTRLKS